jgi:hypothetical protein
VIVPAAFGGSAVGRGLVAAAGTAGAVAAGEAVESAIEEPHSSPEAAPDATRFEPNPVTPPPSADANGEGELDLLEYLDHVEPDPAPTDGAEHHRID